MKGFLRYVTFGTLTAVIPVVAQIQSPSCYTTTTVVFGDPASILSSLSMVSNITNTAPSTATSYSAPSLPFSSSLSSLTSSTSSLANPTVTGLFRITVNVPGPGKLRERGLEYLSFDDNLGFLETDPTVATLFRLINGYLETSTGLYVGASTNEGYTQFEVSSFPPAVAQGFIYNGNGSISLVGASDFCYDNEGALYIVFTDEPSFTCTFAILDVSVVAATTSSETAITSSVVAVQSATSSSIVQLATWSSPVPVISTSNAPISSSLPAVSSQGISSTSLHSPTAQVSTSLILTSSPSSSTAVIPSSTIGQASSSTRSSAILSSASLNSSSGSSSSSSPLPVLTSSLSSASPVVSNPTNIIGPGQLTTPVSSIYSLPIFVSSISSSLSTTTSASTSSSSTIASSSKSSSSSTIVVSSATVIPSSPSSALTSTTPASRSSTISFILTTTISSTSTSSTISSSSSSSSLRALPSPYQRNTGKRGLAYTNVTLTQLYSLQGQSSHISWSYDYYSLPNATDNPGPTNPALTFIPLLYNNAPALTSIWPANAAYCIQTYGSDALFSFNEPDACNNGQSACMSVAASVSAYQTYMQPFAGRALLGAPSVTNGGPPASLTYLSYFLGNCTGCTIDFINLHWYSSPYSFSYLTSYITQAYAVGGNRPIYLTEFGMDSVYYAEADVATFLKNATTWLDAQDYVRRYSWFGDFSQTGPQNMQGFGYLVNSAGTGLSNEGVVFNNYSGGYVPCPGTNGC